VVCVYYGESRRHGGVDYMPGKGYADQRLAVDGGDVFGSEGMRRSPSVC
jgi:hypothetical protein